MWKANLEIEILKESYGNVIATIADCLMTHSALTLKELEYKTKLNQTKISKGLLGLIQHGMVEINQNKQRMVEYRIFQDRVKYHIYFEKEVHCAGILYGDAAEMIVEELQQEGRLPVHILVDTVTNKLNEAIKAQGSDLKEVQPSYVQEKFERMVATHFIKRCPVPVKDKRGKVVSQVPPPEHLLFAVPPRPAAGYAVKVKQEVMEGQPAEKRPTSVNGSQQGSGDDTPTIYWEVNHPRFLQHFRDQMMVSAVANAMDSDKAAEIMRCILRLCEKTTDPGAHTTIPVSLNELYPQLPKDKAMSKMCVEQWLKLMTECMPEFISREGDSGGGMYVVNTLKAMRSLSIAHMESVVEEKLGSFSKRIFRLLLMKGNLEPDMIEKLSLVSPKQCKALLSTMMAQSFIETSMLSSTVDYVMAHTHTLFHVDVNFLARTLLDVAYKTLTNIKLSRQQILSDAVRLLEKQERIEAIILSLGLPASLATGDKGAREGLELDEEKKEQLDTILDTMTPAERQELEKIKARTRHFEMKEQDVVNTSIFVLESYLPLTLNPPRPKPTRKLLN